MHNGLINIRLKLNFMISVVVCVNQGAIIYILTLYKYRMTAAGEDINKQFLYMYIIVLHI